MSDDAATLRAQTCVGQCGRDTPLLASEEVQRLLPALPNWHLSEHGKAIERSFTAKNWGAAMVFLNAVSEVAEAETHHPDLHLTNWREVRLVLQTHAVGGLTRPDFILAAKLDELPVTYSPAWLRERGETSSGPLP